jgi:hypothetical protein
VAVLELVERGQLALDAPLTRYLPELAPAAVERGGVPCTIEHALPHGRVLGPAAYAELIRPRSKDYALGLAVETHAVLGRMIWHNGALTPHGYSSELVYLPEQDLSVVVLSNRPLGVSRTKAFAGALLRKATGQPETVAKSAGVLDLFNASTMLLARLLVPLFLALGLALRAWRRVKLDRVSWVLDHHATAAALAFLLFLYGTSFADPLLWLWAALVFGSAWKRRWWELEPWQPGKGAMAYVRLAGRAAFVLLAPLALRSEVLWVFAAVLAGEASLVALSRATARSDNTIATG